MKHFYIVTAILTTLTACTSYDDTPTAEEIANAAASANYKSQNGDLGFKADGTTTFKGQNLVKSTDVNGQTSYNNITVDGNDFTLITAQTGTGTAIYALNPNTQFSDIGNSIPSNASLTAITSTQFAGKYYERNLGSDGTISGEYSGAILLEFDPNAGTLTSLTGPNITYIWDAASGAFIGTGTTSGTAVSYSDNSVLGTYSQAGSAGTSTSTTGTNYGSFWGVGE